MDRSPHTPTLFPQAPRAYAPLASRLGVTQRKTLERLAGAWLLAERHGHVYWANRAGRLVPPYTALRPDLVVSLRAAGLIDAFRSKRRNRFYTLTPAGHARITDDTPAQAAS